MMMMLIDLETETAIEIESDFASSPFVWGPTDETIVR